jgi:iron-sulfur cluster repair protein YtfE (RIC family)
MLHDDHMGAIALLGRFGSFLRERQGQGTPAAGDRTVEAMLNELATAVETEVTVHFALEEEELFPLMEEAGEGDLPAALLEEHRTILPVGLRVAELARAAGRDGFTDAGWAEFCRLGQTLVSELTAHAEKEEIGFMPMLEEMLEPDVDARITAGYAERR